MTNFQRFNEISPCSESRVLVVVRSCDIVVVDRLFILKYTIFSDMSRTEQFCGDNEHNDCTHENDIYIYTYIYRKALINRNIGSQFTNNVQEFGYRSNKFLQTKATFLLSASLH